MGMFDGVHRGHVFVLEQLVALAKAKNLVPCVITFPVHPLSVLSPPKTPQLILPPEEKMRAIEAITGKDSVILTPFTKALAAETAAEFLQRIKTEQNVQAMAMGYNNHIGSDRLDASHAAQLGIMSVFELPQSPTEPQASSSAIRALLENFDFKTVESFLGRPFAIYGTVTQGKKLGRTIGFPTANIAPDARESQLLPLDGVYAARIYIEGDNTPHCAMLNIGLRPTVDHSSAPQRTIEAHILDFSGNIYGKRVKIEFAARIRPERRFASIEELRAQLLTDKHAIQAHWNSL